MMNKSSWLTGSLLVLSPFSLLALGIRLADQDPLATARGNAFAATADNPSAIYYNPAGITQLEGHHVSVGTYAITYESRHTSAATGASTRTKDKPQATPQLYYVFSPKESAFSFGLGVFSPYGLSLEWPETSGFRTLAIQGRISHLTVNPVVAWQIHETLSIAAGPSLSYAETDLRQGLFSPVPGTDELRFKGDDTDVSFNLGLRWQPHEQHAFGINYRGPSTMNFQGTSRISGAGFPLDGTSAANARFPLPQNIVVGWSYRPTPDWNLEFNADWTDWERLTVVGLNQPGLLLPAVALPFNWRSSWFYEWGVTRKFGKGWHASAGYIFSENSSPDLSFNPVVPDSDRHIFSLGVGRQYQRSRWDAGYQFAYGPVRTVSGSTPSLIGQSANGRYEFTSHALTISVGFAF